MRSMGRLTLPLGFQNRDHGGRWAGDDDGSDNGVACSSALWIAHSIGHRQHVTGQNQAHTAGRYEVGK
jgi:hypothetical protein